MPTQIMSPTFTVCVGDFRDLCLRDFVADFPRALQWAKFH